MGRSLPLIGQSFTLNRLPFLIAAFCILWSSAFAVAKIALEDCPPLLFLMVRFLLAGLIMMAAATFYRQALPGRRDVLALAGLGVMNNAIYLGLSYFGLGTISAGLSALIISANPILTAIAAATVLGERMTLRKAAGLLLGFGGVAFIVQARMASGTDSFHGIIITLGALIALTTGTIFFKLLAPKGGLCIGNGIQNLAGGFALAPFALGFEHLSSITPSWHLLAALTYLVVFGSSMAFLLWFYLLTVAGATTASSYHFLTPPLGMLFGWLLLGEHVALFDLMGILPVAFGIYLVTRPARQVPFGPARKIEEVVQWQPEKTVVRS
jgi:drug/metabolite transporter (DMT)-like permease